MIVAIDGPSGVGKGTVARAVAAALGYRHVDTGAMYRAVAWKALADGVPLADEEALAELADRLVIHASEGSVTVDGRDVSAAIRTASIDRAAARVARLAGVRRVLVLKQREMGAGGAAVMEGRDIGTIVFPDAGVKVYLDAAPEERARRRAHDPAHVGSHDMETVQTELAARDESDRTRTHAPLVLAPDAHLIDTTGLTIDQVVERVLRIVEDARDEVSGGSRGADR
ncbi:MAG: (d)CMP kinase [Acidobacteria bacterium]|nr:MAG: (d)CMP kinase [Acidobacteriota bacterium]